MMRRVLWGIAGLVILLALGFPLYLRTLSSMSAGPAAMVQSPLPGHDASLGLREEDAFLGVVVASGSVELSARSEGRIQSIEVQVGDPIRQGQVLARLETQSLQRELAIAEAGLDSARAEESVASIALAEAQEKLNRSNIPELVRLGAIPEEERAATRYQERTAAARLELARAQVRDRQARLEQLRLQLAEASIKAPFDGVVAQRYLDPGALVSAGRSILHLLRKGALKVRFAIPEDQARRVMVGTPLRVAVQGTSLQLRGQVENVSPEVDTAARMVLAIASLMPEHEGRVPSGTVVRVSLLEPEPLGSGQVVRTP